jgi:uncharacterized protein (DUF58 family)
MRRWNERFGALRCRVEGVRLKLSPDRTLLGWASVWLFMAIVSVPLVEIRNLVPIGAVLLAAALLTDAVLALWEKPIGLEREVPEKGARGREAEITLQVHNPLSRPVTMQLRDSVPRDLVWPEPHWSRLELEAGARRSLRYTIRPQVRGHRDWGRAVALVRSPLGLLRRCVESTTTDSLLVQPETARYLRPEALDPRRVLAMLGVRPRRLRGEGLEFDSLRDYVIGDEPRRIDWRATARRGRPVVRTHRHEESRTVLIALDRSRLMGARAPHPDERTSQAGFASTKLDHAIDAALALTFASLVAGDRVGLVVFDRSVVAQIVPVAHRASLGLFVDALSGIQPSPFEADYRRVTRDILTRQRKRAMVIVLTDFMEIHHEELIQPMSLLGRRHEVVFVALREPILEQLEEDESNLSGSKDAEKERVGLYRRIVLADLLREREGRMVMLRRQGLSVLDVPPTEATASTLNRYMELRYGLG